MQVPNRNSTQLAEMETRLHKEAMEVEEIKLNPAQSYLP